MVRFTRWCAEILQLSPHSFSGPLRNTIFSAATRESSKGRRHHGSPSGPSRCRWSAHCHFGRIGAGSVIGGFAGALVGLGIPEYEAKRYEGSLQKGAILVSVHCDTSDEIKLAKAIMKSMGGDHISSTGESSTRGEDHPRGVRSDRTTAR